MNRWSIALLVLVICLAVLQFFGGCGRGHVKNKPSTDVMAFDDISSTITEADIKNTYPDAHWEYSGPGSDHSKEGDRVCQGDIKNFNGIDCDSVYFAFVNNNLIDLKINVPHESYPEIQKRLSDAFGTSFTMNEDPTRLQWFAKNGIISAKDNPSDPFAKIRWTAKESFLRVNPGQTYPTSEEINQYRSQQAP